MKVSNVTVGFRKYQLYVIDQFYRECLSAQADIAHLNDG